MFSIYFLSFSRIEQRETEMNEIELASLLSFVEVVQSFLGNRKADNYKGTYCTEATR